MAKSRLQIDRESKARRERRLVQGVKRLLAGGELGEDAAEILNRMEERANVVLGKPAD